MPATGSERVGDAVVLLARLLLAALFLISGWGKLVGFAGTVGYMAGKGLPLPELAAAGAVFLEVVVALAVVGGVATRPAALLLAVYTVATGFIGHPFWTMVDPARAANQLHFLKNLGIAGGFLLLYVTGAGRFSLDAALAGRRETALRTA